MNRTEKSESWVVYVMTMRNAEGNGGSPSGWRDADGRLWFATMGGAVTVDPAHLESNRMAPPVAIEEALADEARLPASGEWHLSPGLGHGIDAEGLRHGGEFLSRAFRPRA